MKNRLVTVIRIAVPILLLAAIALGGQAGQRWGGG
jgi:hypothetical protein